MKIQTRKSSRMDLNLILDGFGLLIIIWQIVYLFGWAFLCTIVDTCQLVPTLIIYEHGVAITSIFSFIASLYPIIVSDPLEVNFYSLEADTETDNGPEKVDEGKDPKKIEEDEERKSDERDERLRKQGNEVLLEVSNIEKVQRGNHVQHLDHVDHVDYVDNRDDLDGINTVLLRPRAKVSRKETKITQKISIISQKAKALSRQATYVSLKAAQAKDQEDHKGPKDVLQERKMDVLFLGIHLCWLLYCSFILFINIYLLGIHLCWLLYCSFILFINIHLLGIFICVGYSMVPLSYLFGG
ncbi:uncharacterized protein LOC111703615 isoform X2 [Eurytemora carolleeae]|uniref:uncharacterized protein LOC111703615 isoform X2 n=1 Tax=Eurytemora carolleeae TaxID=1294199 RepID=UPI000C789DD1|nr:uncharacterized protein LOC111703615 isoform X2 [Eurytemora carolleeae]|eukprot:XP_023331370.1 uncharacterized protein LOC111703615 isoform X2 [Eurytemora affinis]